MRYLISFDIRDRNTDREAVNKELKCIGAKPVLRSQWVLNSVNATIRVTNKDTLYNHLQEFFNEKDRILISTLSAGRFVEVNLLTKINRT